MDTTAYNGLITHTLNQCHSKLNYFLRLYYKSIRTLSLHLWLDILMIMLSYFKYFVNCQYLIGRMATRNSHKCSIINLSIKFVEIIKEKPNREPLKFKLIYFVWTEYLRAIRQIISWIHSKQHKLIFLMKTYLLRWHKH